MKDFIAIDFETANPKRVSACSIGYAKVSEGEIVETGGHLIKPIGGHADFQSNIHGIKDEHTFDKPMFGDLFPKIKHIFDFPLVSYSGFDEQVLFSLAEHFSFDINPTFTDSSEIAREKLPDLKNYKLKTVAKFFRLPPFKHHDAEEDAITCAKVFLCLGQCERMKSQAELRDEAWELKGIIKGILADDEINYKEALHLLYWLEDHAESQKKYIKLFTLLKTAIEDGLLDSKESASIKKQLLKLLV